MNRHMHAFLVSWRDPSGRVFVWESAGTNSNERATRLLEMISTIQKLLSASESVFLSTIEIEMEPGKYPTILSKYFEDEEWTFAKRFCSARACKITRGETVTVGHFTFEDNGGVISRLLPSDGGLRWGSALRIGGYRVSDSVVDQVMNVSLFDLDEAEAIMRQASLVWHASPNLDRLYVWSNAEERRDLERLFPDERVRTSDP